MKKIFLFLILLSTFVLSKTFHPKDNSIDLTDLNTSTPYFVKWNNLPVLVYKRSKKEIEDLKRTNQNAIIPQTEELFINSIKKISKFGNEIGNYYLMEKNTSLSKLRSKRDDIFVGVYIDTIKGCMLDPFKLITKNNQSYFQTDINCYKNKYFYDTAGRYALNISNKKEKVYSLYIPPHHYEGNKLIIGIQTRLKEYKKNNFNKTPYFKMTPSEKLYYGALNCRYDIVKKALKNNANVNKKVYRSMTAIYAAIYTRCKSNKINILNEILKHKPNLNVCDFHQYSPLDTAIVLGDLSSVKLLIQNGANVNFKCASGINKNVLKSKYNKKIFKYLKEKGFEF